MQRTARTIRLVVLVLAPPLVALVVWLRVVGPLRNPQEALLDFYEARDRAEDQLVDPLILVGPRVHPLVLEAIKDPEMRRRRYAIGFLGNQRYAPALPVLLAIVENASERDYFRGDALEAICQIEPEVGRQIAQRYTGDPTYLGRAALGVLASCPNVGLDRTWLQALISCHDC